MQASFDLAQAEADNHMQIPVRQASLASASQTSTLATCKKVIETVALARPGVKWSLWEERAVGTSLGTGPKRVLMIPEVSMIVAEVGGAEW